MKRKVLLGVLALVLAIGSYKITVMTRSPSQGRSAAPLDESASGRPEAVGESSPRIAAKKAETNKRADAGRGAVIKPSDYPLYRDDGLINKELLSLAGIPQGESARFEALVEKTWEELSRDFESRAQLVNGSSEEEGGTRTYFVPASREVAEKQRQRLHAELAASFGEAAAKMLTPYLSSPGNFAGFGALDAKIVLSPRESMGKPVTMADYTFSDPGTGRALYSGATTVPRIYKRHMGSSFMTHGDGE